MTDEPDQRITQSTVTVEDLIAALVFALCGTFLWGAGGVMVTMATIDLRVVNEQTLQLWDPIYVRAGCVWGAFGAGLGIAICLLYRTCPERFHYESPPRARPLWRWPKNNAHHKVGVRAAIIAGLTAFGLAVWFIPSFADGELFQVRPAIFRIPEVVLIQAFFGVIVFRLALWLVGKCVTKSGWSEAVQATEDRRPGRPFS